jgi:ribosomal protein S18 acetylase RimI-like enzyme
MEIKQITEKKVIQNFLLKDPYLHIYEMGDLQDKLFGNISWHAAVENNVIKAIAMVYMTHEPILFLLEDNNPAAAAGLLESIIDKLPEKIYCHLTKGLSKILEKKYRLQQQGIFLKMKLTGDLLLDGAIKYPEYTYRLNKNDFDFIKDYLKRVNPNAFFVHGMLDTEKYLCIRKNNEIICMAGVHLYSKEFSVAAIGNIVTGVKYRGKGFAKSVTASLCRDLWGEVKYIGLNVKKENIPAIKAYERIGFLVHSKCEELRAKKI